MLHMARNVVSACLDVGRVEGLEARFGPVVRVDDFVALEQASHFFGGHVGLLGRRPVRVRGGRSGASAVLDERLAVALGLGTLGGQVALSR